MGKPAATDRRCLPSLNHSFTLDFIITGRAKALLEDEVRPVVTAFLRERGLALSLEKTKITPIEDGFDFLGQNVRKHHNRILIKPAKKNVQRFLTKVRAVIQGNQQATTEHLILQLNPMIRGWANYHRFVASKQTLREVDNAIFLVVAMGQTPTPQQPPKMDQG
jgi:RNA-directed DNA polymerase